MNPFTKRLETVRFRCAAGFREHLDASAEKLFQATTVEILSPWAGGIPLPEDKRLDKFQRLGVRHALERNHSYIAFEQGLGKTPVACGVINALNVKTLILLPPDLITSWQRHILEWSVRPTSIGVVDGKTNFNWIQDCSVILCPDTIIDRFEVEESLKQIPFGLVILEECDRFSTPTARRTQSVFGEPMDGFGAKALTGLCHLATKTVCLSGTPMRGKPIEMFPVLSSLALNTIDYRNKLEYGVRYCGGYESSFGWNFNGASNADEWRRKVVNIFMRREEQMDHLKVKKTQRIVYLSNKLKPRTIKLERAILGGKQIADFIDNYEIMGAISKNKQLGMIARYRKEIGQQKMRQVVGHVKKVLDQNKRGVLLLAYHEKFIEAVTERLRNYNPLVIQGKTPKARRIERIDAFQRGASGLMIAQLGTMVGHNITAATYVCVAEFSWSKRDNDQAIDRPMRHTQKKNILVEFLVAQGTLEDYVVDILLKKNKVVKAFINKKRK